MWTVVPDQTTPVDCSMCRGACCETIVFPSNTTPSQIQNCLPIVWIGVEPKLNDQGNWIAELQCAKLDQRGLCSIYEDRPNACRQLLAGGEWCLEALQRRRTPEQRSKIMRLDAPSS